MLALARTKLLSALRAAGSLLPSALRPPPSARRLVQPWRDDVFHSHPSVGLTPSRALNYLHAADAGSPQVLFELYGEMLRKWPRLAAVEATRRLALTGLDWEILPAASRASANPAAADQRSSDRDPRLDESPDRAGPRESDDDADIGDRPRRAGDDATDARGRAEADATAIADFCRDALDRATSLNEALDHLAGGLAYGIAVVELVWEDGRLVELVPVPHTRLIGDPDEPWRVRVLTEDEPTRGVAVDEQPVKWIVHCPGGVLGRPFEGGLLRACLPLYLAQNLSFKDWLIYSQIAGMPVRVAQFEPGIPDAEKNELLNMLERLGTDAVAAFRKGIELKFIESAHAGDKPYLPIQEYCNTEVTILWLGQHLTTDMRSSGSRAAAEVHDRVREDLLTHDIQDESRVLRRALLAPLVAGRFGPAAPVPLFRRSLVQSIDTRSLAETLAVAVRDLGLQVPRRWVHQALGIPGALADEAVLSPR